MNESSTRVVTPPPGSLQLHPNIHASLMFMTSAAGVFEPNFIFGLNNFMSDPVWVSLVVVSLVVVVSSMLSSMLVLQSYSQSPTSAADGSGVTWSVSVSPVSELRMWKNILNRNIRGETMSLYWSHQHWWVLRVLKRSHRGRSSPEPTEPQNHRCMTQYLTQILTCVKCLDPGDEPHQQEFK